jgi:hypothetical protein
LVTDADGCSHYVSGDNEVHLHHVVPNNILADVVIKQDNTDLERDLTDYINQPHIRSLIEKAMSNRFPKDTDGVLLNASISWNPNNLVAGPNPNARTDDRKNKIDNAILKHQSTEFQTAVADFQQNPSIRTFSEIPEAQSVHYKCNLELPQRLTYL